MKLTTAGESHGKALIGIIEGLPSNLKIDIDEINKYLSLRQSGYGRGGRGDRDGRGGGRGLSRGGRGIFHHDEDGCLRGGTRVIERNLRRRAYSRGGHWRRESGQHPGAEKLRSGRRGGGIRPVRPAGRESRGGGASAVIQGRFLGLYRPRHGNPQPSPAGGTGNTGLSRGPFWFRPVLGGAASASSPGGTVPTACSSSSRLGFT